MPVVLQPIAPFEPIRSEEPPTRGAWTAQVKWDGVRILAYLEPGADAVRLFNRKQHERTRQYPELTEPRRYCSADSFILDGEVMALDERGRPSFSRVMKRDGLRSAAALSTASERVPIVYMVFDILYVHGEWVTDRPLRERQALLSEVLIPGKVVQTVDNVADSAALFEVMRQHDMEGIVCKDLNSRYAIGGKDKRWVKVKNYRDLHAVVGGVTFRGRVVNALALGLYWPDGRLQAIGYAGTGKLTAADWAELTTAVSPLVSEHCPFDVPNGLVRGTTWLRPVLTAKIRFLEWTPHATLRQPSIQALGAAEPSACVMGQA